MAASATFALKAGVWFRRGRLLMVSPDSRGTACPPSGRNSTYRPVQISGTGSEFKDGEFTGKGTVYAAKGAMTSSGPLADGKFVGTVADQETIRMEINSGVYVVPVRFNDTITLDAVVDSGATDLSIPADVVLTLMRTNTISQQDFLGQQTY